MRDQDQTQRDRQARDIFLRAVEIESREAQAAYIEGACQHDASLRSRVEALLENHRKDSFLEAPAIDKPTVLSATPLSESPGTVIGRYKLLQRIGEGGMGVVYMAEQEEPVRRRVALKIIKLGMDTKSVIARFEAERQALAMMDHPNIAKVLDGGATETGRPYFVMELVRGIKITEYCDEAKLSTRERLDLFIKVCQAIQHAHQKGIIHRDIKPSNILVTINDGVAVPKVIDFGIAKATEGRLTDKTLFTQFEALMGTPAYMSPEQAVMTSLDIDTRSDIYSLGVLLYELLAGSTPFDAKELMASGIDAMRKTIREKEPLRPSTKLSQTLVGVDVRRLTSKSEIEEEEVRASSRRLLQLKETIALLRGDLDWIVMKCLEKDRARRYETANGLASDLQRHLNNEAVLARPPSAAYRFQKTFRRNRLAFAAGGAIALALVIGAVVSSWQAFRAIQAERAAIAERTKTEKALAEEAQQRLRAEGESAEKTKALAAARRNLYAADMVLAQQALASGNLGRTRELLSNHQPKTGELDIRGWEWRYLWGHSGSDELFTLGHHSNGVLGVAFSPKGNILASGSRDRTVKLWDLSTRRQTAEFVLPDQVQWLAFSRTGNLLATASHGKNVLLWDVVSREEVWRVPMTNDLSNEWAPEPIAFSPRADDVLAVGDQSGVVALWNTTTRAQLISNTVMKGCVDSLAYSGDGKQLAVGTTQGLIQICEANSLRPLVSLTNHNLWITSLSFSPDNSLLASSSYDHTIILWNTKSGAEIGRLTNHTAWVGGLAFLPDGQRLVSVSADHSIRFWDVATLQEIARLRGHEHEVHRVAVSPDGMLLATGSKDSSVKLWNTIPKSAEQSVLVLDGGDDHTISADRKVLLSRRVDGTMQLRDAKDLSLLRTFNSPVTNYSTWALSPGGRALAFGQDDGHVRVWSTTEQKFLADFKAHAGRIIGCLYSADGRIMATVGDDMKVRVWEIRTGKVVHEYAAPHVWLDVRFVLSPDGQTLAFGYENENDSHGFVRLWDLGGRGEIATFPAHLEIISDMAFSADGKMLATASTDGTAKLWDVNDVTQPRFVLRGRLLSVNSVAFSPDDRRLAVSGDGGETKIWDVRSGQELMSLKGGDGFIHYTYFVDEDTLLTGSGTPGVLKTEFFLRHAPSLAEIAAAEAKEKAESKQP